MSETQQQPIPFDQWQKDQNLETEKRRQARLADEALSKTVVRFGKYNGSAFEEMPLSYLDWLIGQAWLRDPIKAKLTQYLTKTPIQRAMEKENIR